MDVWRHAHSRISLFIFIFPNFISGFIHLNFVIYIFSTPRGSGRLVPTGGGSHGFLRHLEAHLLQSEYRLETSGGSIRAVVVQMLKVVRLVRRHDKAFLSLTAKCFGGACECACERGPLRNQRGGGIRVLPLLPVSPSLWLIIGDRFYCSAAGVTCKRWHKI